MKVNSKDESSFHFKQTLTNLFNIVVNTITGCMITGAKQLPAHTHTHAHAHAHTQHIGMYTHKTISWITS